jgi:hypothetical protein
MAWEWPQGKQSTDAMAQLAAAYDIKMPMEVEALMKSHPDMLDAEQVEHVVQAARQSLVQSYGIDLSNHRLTDCWICHR